MTPRVEDREDEKTRVAIVHHNTLLREGLCRILETDDFRVVCQRGDGAGVVALTRDHSPDVVLLEWEAPFVDIPLVKELSASCESANVVIVSRPDTEDDLAQALDAGAAGCLSVNLGSQDFLSALRLLARGDILVSHEMVPAVTSGSGAVDSPQDILTPRELEILRALGKGATNQEIAQELLISQHTVKIHVRRVLAKLGFRNRQQAAAYAATEGLL